MGTDTDAGKTVVSAGILQELLAKGVKAAYYKPVASGGDADLRFVAEVNQFTPEPKHCPIIFEEPVSPHLAARKTGVTLTKDILFKGIHALEADHDAVVIEGAGGIIVPLNDKGLFQYHLFQAFDGHVILVARTGVGTINHTLLSASYLKEKQFKVAGIVFNGYTGADYEDDNMDIICRETGWPILGVVRQTDGTMDQFRNTFARDINIDLIHQLGGHHEA